MSSQLRASHQRLERNSMHCPRVPNRVFVDATYTLSSGRRSGIERVVTNLRRGCGKLALEAGLPTKTLMSVGGSFYEIGACEEAKIDCVIGRQRDIVSNLPTMYRQAIAPLVRMTGSKKLKAWMLPDPGHMGMFKLPYRYWYRQKLQHICQQSQRMEIGMGDLLILPDAYWARKEIWPAVQQARAQGAFVVSVVYDLIPLTHPEFVGERRTRRFGEYLRHLASHSDYILSISETVQQELENTLPGLMGDTNYCHSFGAFPLGAEFPETNGQVRPSLQKLFSDDPGDNPYLTVAAFDPRKNHRYLLDAFDRLWARDPNRKLCLVGRVGSRCDDVVERIAHMQRQGRPLFAFHDLNDAELQFCYRRCRSVIFPSIVEGFGLPIVEALWHGQPTFASDTAIHREVGRDHCQYFDLSNPDSLVELIVNQADTRRRVATASVALSPRPHSWSDSAKIFFDKCLSAFGQEQASQVAEHNDVNRHVA